MAMRTLGKQAKTQAFDDASAHARLAQETQGFYTTAQDGDEKEALKKQLTGKMKEIFPDRKYWAAAQDGPANTLSQAFTFDGKDALIDKLISVDKSLAPEKIRQELDGGARYPLKGGGYSVPVQGASETHYVDVKNGKFSITLTQTVYLSPGEAAVENIASVLADEGRDGANIGVLASNLLSTIKTASHFGPDRMIADLQKKEYVQDVLIPSDAFLVAEAYSLCKDILYLQGTEFSMMIHSPETLGDFALILRLDPDNADKIARTFYVLGTSYDLQEVLHRDLLQLVAKEAGKSPYIEDALAQFNGIFRIPNDFPGRTDGTPKYNKDSTCTGYTEKQLMQAIPGCGKYVGAFLCVLSNARNKELAALPGKESIMGHLKAVLQDGELKDEAKCKVIHALLAGTAFADAEVLAILGYKGFESWQKKSRPEKEAAMGADFIGVCNGKITGEEYMKKLKKY